MGILNKTAILQADDRPVRPVACPEWGGEVCVRGLSGRERQVFVELADGADAVGSAVALFRLGTCGKDGKRIDWTDDEMEQLADRSAGPLFRVAEAVGELSGLTAAAVEEVEGNS